MTAASDRPGTVTLLDQVARSELEFMASVVPVVDVTPEGMTPAGTAFFVSELGLLFAARHSVDGFLPADVSVGDHYGHPNERLFILVPSGNTASALHHRTTMLITQIALEPRLSDVAILEVNMETYPAEMRTHFRPWPLAHHRPTTGEDCVVAGYADMKVGELIDATGMSPDLEWQQKLRFAEGVVGNVHPGGRDSLLAPHPCFEVLAASNGGMSGGQKLDHHRQQIGSGLVLAVPEPCRRRIDSRQGGEPGSSRGDGRKELPTDSPAGHQDEAPIMTATCRATGCTNPVVANQRGRPALYCSPKCRSSYSRSRRLTVEVEHPETCPDGRPPERVWMVRLRRGCRTVVVGEALGWPSAHALAGELNELLTGPTRQKGGRLE
jgi:hypothetical protein